MIARDGVQLGPRNTRNIRKVGGKVFERHLFSLFRVFRVFRGPETHSAVIDRRYSYFAAVADGDAIGEPPGAGVRVGDGEG